MTANNSAIKQCDGAACLRATHFEPSPADCPETFCPRSTVSTSVCSDKRPSHEAAPTRPAAGGAAGGREG